MQKQFDMNVTSFNSGYCQGRCFVCFNLNIICPLQLEKFINCMLQMVKSLVLYELHLVKCSD